MPRFRRSFSRPVHFVREAYVYKTRGEGGVTGLGAASTHSVGWCAALGVVVVVVVADCLIPASEAWFRRA
jgi:hypothetical protein